MYGVSAKGGSKTAVLVQGVSMGSALVLKEGNPLINVCSGARKLSGKLCEHPTLNSKP